jgi:5'-deoxynucleotidase YfbR-like HD superfamily hydrolase
MQTPSQATAYRWHCHPIAALRDSKDDIRGHMVRVASNCFLICDYLGFFASANLFHAAETHDLPELIMGDWPYTLTRDYWIARLAKHILEWQIKRKMGLRWNLTRQEKLILALADKLDAIEWAAAHSKPDEFAHYFADDVRAAYDLAAWLGPEVGNWLHKRLGDKGVRV